jgi:hypothetical protein
MPEILESPIADPEDWAAVEFLIREIQQAEWTAKRYAAAIVFWNTAVRFFRQAERILLFEQGPSPEDLKIHEGLLYALLSFGQLSELRIQKISDEDLAKFGIRRENLATSIHELKDSFWMWHGREASDLRDIADCDAIAREGFAMLDAEEAKIEQG